MNTWSNQRRAALILALLFLFTPAVPVRAADDRIWFNATVNAKPVKMVFDTGSEVMVVTRPAAKRLGLKIFELPSDAVASASKGIYPWTDECDFKWEDTERHLSFVVLDVPKGLNFEADGIFSWHSVRQNVLFLDWERGHFAFAGEPPRDLTGWTRFAIKTNQALVLEFPTADRGLHTLAIDTGSPDGIALSPEAWKRWRQAQPNKPTSFNSLYQPVAGFMANEVAWADPLKFGDLVIRGVPIEQASAKQVQVAESLGASSYEATIGLAALKRLELIVDGIGGTAYVRAKTNAPRRYSHNMLGAAFVPPDANSDRLIAHVAAGSPAEIAGIKNGDVLLKINTKDVTKWRSNPAISINTVFIDRKPGEKVVLVLERGSEKLTVTAVLKNILGPPQ